MGYCGLNDLPNLLLIILRILTNISICCNLHGSHQALHLLKVLDRVKGKDIMVQVGLVQLGGEADPVHGVVPLLLPRTRLHLHLIIGQQTFVQQPLYCSMLKIFANENQFLASISIGPFLKK